jgi:Tfp pilus assembly protein PilO
LEIAEWVAVSLSGALIAALGWIWRLSALLERLQHENREIKRLIENRDKQLRSNIGIQQLQQHYRLETLELCLQSIERYLESKGEYQPRPRPRPPSPGENTGADFLDRSY